MSLMKHQGMKKMKKVEVEKEIAVEASVRQNEKSMRAVMWWIEEQKLNKGCETKDRHRQQGWKCHCHRYLDIRRHQLQNEHSNTVSYNDEAFYGSQHVLL